MQHYYGATLGMLLAAVIVMAAAAVQADPDLPHGKLVMVPKKGGRTSRMAVSVRAAAALPAEYDTACNTAKTMYTCTADCITRLTCIKSGTGSTATYKALGASQCGTSTPYCIDGVCVSTLNATALAACSTSPTASTEYVCLDNGYYPDLTDCTKYYFCAGLKAYASVCPSGTTYDQKTTLCKPRGEVACFTLKCPASGPYAIQAFTPYPNLFALCSDASAKNAVIAKCDSGYVIDDTTDPKNPVCAPGCVEAGRVKDPADTTTPTTKYIECFSIGGGKFSKPLSKTCPNNSTFDEASQRCKPT